jgi:type IV secretory pathway TraG/TraD family ATPase VirD4
MRRLREWFRGLRSLEQAETDPAGLRRPLVRFSPADIWRLQDAVEGTIIVSATGGGKTSGSGATIAKSLLLAGCGGLVLTAKVDEADLWKKYCRETGRELVVFSPTGDRTWNFLDYELRHGTGGAGLTENLVQVFCNVIEVLERSSGGGQDFWQRATRQVLRNAITLAVVSRGTLTIDLLHEIITSSPSSPEELACQAWQKSSACMACVREGEQKQKTADQERDFQIAVKFFLREFATLNPRTRSCITAT